MFAKLVISVNLPANINEKYRFKTKSMKNIWNSYNYSVA